MRTSIGVVILLALAGFGVVSGCGGNTTGGSSARAQCERFGSKLRSCGLLSNGDMGCDAVTEVPCEVRCFMNASCSELDQAYCQDRLSEAIDRCFEGCDADEEEQEFACRDGERIPGDWKCDGEEDCLDGSDEAGCSAASTFVCDDGEPVPASWKCDGEADCLDASDERGCPPRAELTCGDSGADDVDFALRRP